MFDVASPEYLRPGTSTQDVTRMGDGCRGLVSTRDRTTLVRPHRSKCSHDVRFRPMGTSERERSTVAMIISTLRIVTAPKSRAEVIRTLAAQLGPTRVQPGCVRCDLYRDVEDQGAITLVEEWASQADLDLRLRSEDYRCVLAAIELSREQPVFHFDTVTRRAGLEIVASARG